MSDEFVRNGVMRRKLLIIKVFILIMGVIENFDTEFILMFIGRL